MLTLLLLTNLFACIEPPPTATEGGTEPSGAAKPGAPEPGEGPYQPLPTPPVRAHWTTRRTRPQSLNRMMGGASGSTKAAVHTGCPRGRRQPELVARMRRLHSSLLVRIENVPSTPPTLSTQKAFDAPGTGTIMAPKEIDAVLMVVDDADKNGQPTPGERIGIWTGGLLKTSEAPDLIELEVGKVPDEPPLPSAEDDPNRAQ